MAIVSIGGSTFSKTMDNSTAVEYLTGLLGTTLRVQISDGRMFVGQLKCTDRERNIILATSHEYRQPSPEAIAAAAKSEPVNGKVTANMTSRYVGLVVLPGEHIMKIEMEQYSPSRLRQFDML